MLAKNYIRPSVSPLGTLILFVKKKDGTFILVISYKKLITPLQKKGTKFVWSQKCDDSIDN